MLFKPYFGEYEVLNLFRIGGAGLGNLLFPFSRAYIYSRKTNADLLFPIWPSAKIGPFLRFEKEKRSYIDTFKYNFISRTKLQFKNLANKTISEEVYIANKKHFDSSQKITVEVKGLANFFDELHGYNEELLQLFLQVASNKVAQQYRCFDENSIGIHIRLGDYHEDARTPISWYKHTIASLQATKEFENSKFIIFSDGKDDELEEILNLPNCTRVSNPNALADILRLSKCRLIIGSNSTFSAWAAFLGKKPFIRHEKFYLKNIFQEDSIIFEGHCVEEFLRKKTF